MQKIKLKRRPPLAVSRRKKPNYKIIEQTRGMWAKRKKLVREMLNVRHTAW